MRKKILIIEEDKTVTELFGKALEPRGFDVYAIGTPDKGIEKAIEIEPDLIFIDLIFHESNGLKVSKLLHSVEKLRNVPIVMLISHRSDLDPKYTSTLGVVDTIVKPLKEEVILAKTLTALGPDVGATVTEETEDDLYSDQGPEGLFDEDRVFSELMTDQQEFVTEADRLIDQAILKQPGDKVNTTLKSDDAARDDFSGEKPGLPEKSIAQYPDFEAAPGPPRKENPFEDDQFDWKDDKTKKTFKDEFEDANQGLSGGPAADEVSGEMFEEEDELEQTGTSRRKILIVAAVLLIAAAAGLGSYQAWRFFSPPQTASAPPKAAPKEVIKETLPSAKEVKPEEPAAKEVTPEKPAPKAVAPAGPVAEKEPPRVVMDGNKPPSKEPVSKEKGNAAFKFSVQAGYFENGKNAESLASDLKKKGYDAFVLKTETAKKGSAGSRTFYRVLIGTFDNIKIAEVQAKTLRQKEGLKVIVYRN